MITPSSQLLYKDDNDFPAPLPLTITYPVGAGTFSLQSAPAWVSINAGTGVIDIPVPASAVVGVYTFGIKYTASAVDHLAEFTLAIDTHWNLNIDEFKVCENDTAATFQLAYENPETLMSSVSKTGGHSSVTISSSGLVTVDIGALPAGINTINVSYSNGFSTITDTFTVEKLACANVDLNVYTNCSDELIGVAWINANGGYEYYYFGQINSFGEDQSDGKTFVNSDREKKYSTRGDVYDVVECKSTKIPKAHIERIAALRRSIQAFVFTDPADEDTYTPIFIQQGSFNKFQTDQEYYTLSFRFTYAKPKTIQNQ